MVGKLKDLLRLSGGEWLVSFTTRENPGKLFDKLKEADVSVDIKKANRKRSLDANNYAWLLIDKLAEATRISETEIYRNVIREIGGISDYYGVREEAFETFKSLWIGGHLGRQVEIIPGSGKPGWVNVRAWRGSSDFDTAQMSRFIDLLVHECEQQGVATIGKEEEERLKKQWGKA